MRASTLKRMALAGAMVISLSGLGIMSQQSGAQAATPRNVHAQNRLQSNRAQDSRAQDDPQAVVAAYYTILNAGLKNGNFGMLSSVYAPDATLTQSNPKGLTTVIHGLAAIIHFYHGLWMKLAWLHFTPEQVRVLAPGIVLAYEHAGTPAQKIPGRCSHLFMIQNGKIVSLDWVTFYAGER